MDEKNKNHRSNVSGKKDARKNTGESQSCESSKKRIRQLSLEEQQKIEDFRDRGEKLSFPGFGQKTPAAQSLNVLIEYFGELYVTSGRGHDVWIPLSEFLQARYLKQLARLQAQVAIGDSGRPVEGGL